MAKKTSVWSHSPQPVLEGADLMAPGPRWPQSASSSSRWSLRRDALCVWPSSSASSSCRLSCFILALAFSILRSYRNQVKPSR